MSHPSSPSSPSLRLAALSWLLGLAILLGAFGGMVWLLYWLTY